MSPQRYSPFTPNRDNNNAMTKSTQIYNNRYNDNQNDAYYNERRNNNNDYYDNNYDNRQRSPIKRYY